MVFRKSAGWTLRSRVRIMIALLFAMLAVLLLVNNLYYYKLITNSSLNDQRNTMAIYLEQIKNNLHGTTAILNELANDYSRNVSDFNDRNELKKYFAMRDMATLLEVKMASNPFLECIFFSNPKGRIYLTRYNALIPWDRKFSLDDYVKAAADFPNDVADEGWHIVRVLDNSYLMQVFRLNDVNIGAIIRLSGFLQEIEHMSGEREDQVVFLDNEGSIIASGSRVIVGPDEKIPAEPEIIRNYKGRYVVISLQITEASVTLSLVKDKGNIYSTMSTVQYLLIAFGLIALAVVIVSSVFVNRYILVPLRKLYHATREVKQGNLDFQIPESDTSLEYQALVNSFNSMVKEIKDLKIAHYEENLEKHRAELKYLQTQLKPHFYLNAINTISSLSLQSKNKEIRKFVMALSQYLRYLFTDNLMLVPLKNEIDHAVDYIKLQQIKHPNLIFYMVEVDEEAERYLLPKLIVHTFIENIFKHAFTGDEMLSVFIEAKIVEAEGARFAKITIEDNGEGFDQERLAAQRSAADVGMGIDIVQKTLSLEFGRDDLVTLANREEGGARVVIMIPEKRTET